MNTNTQTHLTLAGGCLWRKLMSVCGHKRAPVEHIILFLSSGDLVSEVWVVNMSVEKRFRRYVDPCQCFRTPDDTHDLCVFWAKSMRALFSREWSARIVSFSLWESSALVCPFSRENWGNHLPPCGSGPAAEAARRLRSWGSQMELADESAGGINILRASAADESKLLEEDVLSLTSSDPAGSALLAHGQEWVDEDEEDISEPSKPVCPAYDELLEVMERATARLDLQWRHEKGGVARSRLDERFLSGHNLPAPVSLPFLPDLHSEIMKAWEKPYSARIHRYKHNNYADIEGMHEHGYASMPPIEGTLASYLSRGVISTLKAPALPSKPLKETSRLNGRAYAAAGQAGAALHTMSVLQAYQADLLKDLDQGQGLPPEAVTELCRTTDLALRATKQMAATIGRPMAAMVATERHLWMNLADIGEKEKRFLLDALVSPSELFGTSVETVVEKFKEVKARSAAFKSCIPRRSRSEPERRGGPGPSRSADHRQGQVISVGNRGPPRRSRSQRRRKWKDRTREMIQRRRGQPSAAGGT